MDADKPTLIVMCGLPGSGKSTWAEMYASHNPEYVVVSTDKIREEMFGDETDQSNGWEVMQSAYKRLCYILKTGNNAIFDATNIKRRYRKNILEFFHDYDINKKLVFVNTSIEICKERNRKRDRVVPENVIDNMAKSLAIKPSVEEGWDEIIIIKEVI